MVLAATSLAMAQALTQSTNDELGAHLGYGRGCVMCHAPHSGSLGNNAGVGGGITGSDPNNGWIALWGQNLEPYYNLATSFSGDGAAKYPVTLPANPLLGIQDANTVILMCLSCHDGNLAKVSMMHGTTVETLPLVGGNAPTWFGTVQGNTPNNYANDHPVGGYAVVQCGGGYNWDCSGGDTTTSAKKGGHPVTGTVNPGPAITMTGAASSAFVANYPGSFWNNWSSTSPGYTTTYALCAGASSVGVNCSFSNPLSSFSSTSTINGVGCTTCHNQHSMTAYSNSMGKFNTMFFIKGGYSPTTGGNNTAQFCRNCHGGNSNEMVGEMSVPTT
jgi:hypothetical protein